MESSWFSFLDTRFFNYLVRAVIFEQGLSLILHYRKEKKFCLKRAFGITLIMFSLLPHSIIDPWHPRTKKKVHIEDNGTTRSF